MNPCFAAGLFDNPWVILALFAASAVANWLSKRRQEQQARQLSEQGEQPPPAGNPPGGVSLEETLRQLMGEEPTPRSPVPPLAPRTDRVESPPAPNGSEDRPRPAGWPRMEESPEARAPARQRVSPSVPVSQPPAVWTTAGFMASEADQEEEEEASRRFAQLNEKGRHPAIAVRHTHPSPAHAGSPRASRWRNPRAARRAFVASLVFAPPKSFEP